MGLIGLAHYDQHRTRSNIITNHEIVNNVTDIVYTVLAFVLDSTLRNPRSTMSFVFYWKKIFYFQSLYLNQCECVRRLCGKWKWNCCSSACTQLWNWKCLNAFEWRHNVTGENCLLLMLMKFVWLKMLPFYNSIKWFECLQKKYNTMEWWKLRDSIEKLSFFLSIYVHRQDIEHLFSLFVTVFLLLHAKYSSDSRHVYLLMLQLRMCKYKPCFTRDSFKRLMDFSFLLQFFTLSKQQQKSNEKKEFVWNLDDHFRIIAIYD